VRRGTFVHSIRVAGTVEAARAITVIVPRLAGQSVPSLVITHLVPSGASVRAGDLLVEFDRQNQIKAAQDRRAEHLDLEGQIKQKIAEQEAARARDETELKQALNDVGRARLTASTNSLLPRIQAEKNLLALEQAEARVKQLSESVDLRRRAAEADLRILEIRRDRARKAMEHAEANIQRMSVTASFAGLAVLKAVWKGSQMSEVQQGEEVRSGMPIVDVVDPSTMQVRARVSQTDATFLAPGQRARVRLDAYPDLVFDGRVELIAPLAAPSSMTPKVRTCVAVISIAGSHPNLMPDLSAAVDVEVDRRENALILPRDAVVIGKDGASVSVFRGRSAERQAVTIDAASADEVVIGSGVAEGASVARATGRTGA
jgi:multidrug resistance efflux pump